MSTAPERYARQANFTAFEAVNPTTPKPGVSLDAEFNALLTAVNTLISRLAEIQRDDGDLANQSVTPDSLHADTLTMIGARWLARGGWLGGTTYAVDDMVSHSGLNYVCLVQHVAGVFATDLAASKWQSLGSLPVGSDIVITPTGSITSADVQAAMAEISTLLAGKQASHANLTALAGLVFAANRVLYLNGAGALTLGALSANGLSLIGAADYAAMLALLGAVSTAVANVYTAEQTIRMTDAGATEGPLMVLDRNSASPAANDVIGGLKLTGRDSAANTQTFAKLLAEILDPVDGTEDARFQFMTIVAGVLAIHFYLGAGFYAASATGGDPGDGKINATGYQLNGTSLPVTKSYTSSNQTITAAGLLTLAHSLGAMPVIVQVRLKCLTAELNYSIGDEVMIDFFGGYQGGNTGQCLSVVPDATNLNIRYGGAANVFAVPNKTTGILANITNANWAAIFRAFA